MLENQVALITGAGTGIGRAIALDFVASSAHVAVSDIDADRLAETVKLIFDNGADAVSVVGDVSKPEDCAAMVRETVGKYGKLTVAVNNAGIGGAIAPTGEYDLEEWNKVIAINLSGVFYGMRYQIPAMQQAGRGAIVNMASILGQVGFPGAPAYVAAKHGVVGLTRAAALDHAADKIRINAVGPAFIRTQMIQSVDTDPEAHKSLVARHPLGRLGTVEQVANLVTFLCSEDASFITGSYYPVDGGYLSQ
ncbi:MAG: SDR family NAD(P)-dependent oxidoreductase [Armatimonadaceae bacterium]